MAGKTNKLVRVLNENAEDDLFWDKVLSQSKNKLIVIDIHHDWCGPCEVLHLTMHRQSMELSEWDSRCGIYSACLQSLRDKILNFLPKEAAQILTKNGCMPFFAFIKQETVIATMSGADSPMFINLLKQHIPQETSSQASEQ